MEKKNGRESEPSVWGAVLGSFFVPVAYFLHLWLGLLSYVAAGVGIFVIEAGIEAGQEKQPGQ